MTLAVTKIIVDIVGLAVVIFIAWYFWLWKPKGVAAAAGAGGVQEALITVKGGYHPDVIAVQAGRPVRLTFLRKETSACSEMVLFPDFNKHASLPTDEAVVIELTPEKPGEYGFQCGMGMLRGKLIVE